MEIDILPDSDSIYLENNVAWFISRLYNILFKLNLENGRYEYVGALPEQGRDKWRFHPVCVKNKSKIFCLPNRGSCIWIFNLENGGLKQIKIENQNNCRIRIKYLGQYNEKLYAISLGLNQIIAIDLEKQEIEYVYALSSDIEDKLAENTIMIGNLVYGILNSSKTIIYEFDVETVKIRKMVISERRAFYNTIAFDGNKFWLSGSQKELLICDKDGANVEYINGITKNLHILNFTEGCIEKVEDLDSIYEPLFTKSLFLNGKIWFIPFRTDKIIEVDINTHKVNEAFIPCEDEDKLTLLKRKSNLRNYKFFFEYVVAQRYMIVYSLKRERHYSIDTFTGDITEKSCDLSVNNNKKLFEKLTDVFMNKVFYESNKQDILQYNLMFALRKQKKKNKNDSIGERIYQELSEMDCQ